MFVTLLIIGERLMEKGEKIYNSNYVAACYFRSSADANHKKVILQITERCNMFCKHCFVSSSSRGNDLTYKNIKEIILPQLLKSMVAKVTLTGGEPLVHPDINKILKLLVQSDISVAICTNGLAINQSFVDMCYNLGNIHFNISLDGFRAESHGKFRGIENENTFERIVFNISNVANRGMLNGILVTPNIYARIEEYEEICNFAKSIGAKYVLFNPLSEFGRGQYTKHIGYHDYNLCQIKEITQKYIDDNFEVVYIRFPDSDKKLGNCPLGKVLYIFTDGNVAICPYLVFAAKDNSSIYKPEQFFISNIFDNHHDIDYALNHYMLPDDTIVNINCTRKDECSKGCLAAKVSNGLSINDCDFDLCHIKN